MGAHHVNPSSYNSGSKRYGTPPRFDPEQGETVIEPLGKEYGFWAGAPSAAYDPESETFYLYYRLRTPLHSGRGGECRVAASRDGVNFETVWTGKKEEFGANSIEKGSLIQDPSGRWRLYLSYEVGTAYDRNPPTWRVDLMEADSPADFDPALSRPVLDGPMYGFTFIKDPTVIVVGGEYHAYANVGLPQQHDEPDEQGIIRTRGRGWTSLHRSADGVTFPTGQLVMRPAQQGWDAFQRRMTSICYMAPLWVAFYDGATNRADSYDEFCGLATSFDLVNFHFSQAPGPWVRSPHASGSIRYLNALVVGDTVHYYYEYARADRAHELRHNAIKLT